MIEVFAMKIALYRNAGPQEAFGGIETQIIGILRSLAEKGCEVYLITSCDTSELYYRASAYIKKCFIISRNIPIWEKANSLNKIIKENGLEILQCHMLNEYFTGYLAKLRNRSFKLIYRVHTHIDCSYISVWKKKLYHFCTWMASYRTAAFLPINRCNKKELINRSHINKKKIYVIHDAIALNDTGDMSTGNTHWPPTEIAIIANPSRVKRFDILIEAVSKMHQCGVDLRVHIFGNLSDEVYVEKIGRLIRQRKCENLFIFEGFVKDIREAIRGIPVVVLTSESEGTPNCLLEAMSMKKIVVATCVGGIPEFIQDMKSGILCNPKSATAFFEALNRMMNLTSEEAYSMGIAARKAVSGYNIDAVSDQLLLLYKSLMR